MPKQFSWQGGDTEQRRARAANRVADGGPDQTGIKSIQPQVLMNAYFMEYNFPRLATNSNRLSAKRAQQQKQRWFRRGLHWRAGIEATMSTLKHPFSMARATYKGDRGLRAATSALTFMTFS
jgi:hypothetical protein